MRKLKLQVQMSVDGFVGGPNGELDWMQWNWDDGIKKYVDDLTDSVDTILLGRKMTEGFISHWSNVVRNPSDPSYSFAKKMMDKPKFVFSKTLKESAWENTSVINDNFQKEIKNLKGQPGKELPTGQAGIIVYGGAGFVSSLVENNLIDEYYLFVNPTAIGKGLSIFNGRTNLKLVKTILFDCGIVLLNYIPQP